MQLTHKNDKSHLASFEVFPRNCKREFEGFCIFVTASFFCSVHASDKYMAQVRRHFPTDPGYLEASFYQILAVQLR